jgi:hypothetical protein
MSMNEIVVNGMGMCVSSVKGDDFMRYRPADDPIAVSASNSQPPASTRAEPRGRWQLVNLSLSRLIHKDFKSFLGWGTFFTFTHLR